MCPRRDVAVPTTHAHHQKRHVHEQSVQREVHETRAMLAAARQSRKQNAGVPEVRARLTPTAPTCPADDVVARS